MTDDALGALILLSPTIAAALFLVGVRMRSTRPDSEPVDRPRGEPAAPVRAAMSRNEETMAADPAATEPAPAPRGVLRADPRPAPSAVSQAATQGDARVKPTLVRATAGETPAPEAGGRIEPVITAQS